MVETSVRIGIIFLPTDCTGPAELHTIVEKCTEIIAQSVNCIFPPNVEVLNQNTYEYALKRLNDTIDCLRPIGSFSCIGVSCTSFGFAVGANNIRSIINSIHPDVTVIDMTESLFKAAHILSIKRVLVLTAYKSDLNSILKKRIELENFEIVEMNRLGLDTDYEIYCVEEAEIIKSISNLKSNTTNLDSLGIIVSCSALRMLRPGFIDELENITGVPIISSMQAFCWNMLRTTGIKDQFEGFGTLFKNH